MLMCEQIFWTKHSLLVDITILGDQRDRTGSSSEKDSYIKKSPLEKLLPTGYYNRGNYINKRWKFLVILLCDYNFQVLNRLLIKPKGNFTYISD